jgi:hypothetical protein
MVPRTTLGAVRSGRFWASPYGQTLDAQLARLRAEGCAKIYREKASGAQGRLRGLMLRTRDAVAGLLEVCSPADLVGSAADPCAHGPRAAGAAPAAA